jgi:TetR/AcrR family transcriptional regulator, transcriptional repressor of aconitase
MARPDLKDERREQILDAFEACVARYGIEGATLAKIAETADLARPLIRHNVGNREELIAALVERFLAGSQQAVDELVVMLPAEHRAECLIDCLFDPQYSNAQLVQVANALVTASADERALANKMRTWLNNFVDQVTAVLISDFPDAPPEKIAAAAAGITGIYFNVEALYPLGDIKALAAASKDAALTLAASLENNK